MDEVCSLGSFFTCFPDRSEKRCKSDQPENNTFCKEMIPLKTVLLLVGSNIFMTFAWYAHLKDTHSKPLIAAIIVSWLIAFFEYSLQVPANRIGYGAFTLPQLKIIQEAITLAVFVPFAIFYMRVPITWNYFFAGICLFGAVFFIFRDQAPRQDHPANEPNKSAQGGVR